MLIRCKVESVCGGNAWHVTFPDHPGRSLFFQSDWDQAAFAYSCGAKGMESGSPSDPAFPDVDPGTLTQCPDDYLDVADLTQ